MASLLRFCQASYIEGVYTVLGLQCSTPKRHSDCLGSRAGRLRQAYTDKGCMLASRGEVMDKAQAGLQRSVLEGIHGAYKWPLKGFVVHMPCTSFGS